MKNILLLVMVIFILVISGCSGVLQDQSEKAADIENSNDVIEGEQKTEPNTEPAPDVDQIDNDFSLRINNGSISVREWFTDSELEELLGKFTSETVEELGKGADTHSGSLIKKLEYDGLYMELFSPKQKDEFWVMSMEVTRGGYTTSKGIEVGNTVDDIKNIYPDIQIALDGRTDPNNCAYEIADQEQYNYLQFEVKDGLVKEIKIYHLIP